MTRRNGGKAPECVFALTIAVLLVFASPGLATHFSDAQTDVQDECGYLDTRQTSRFAEEKLGLSGLPSVQFKDHDSCDENEEDASNEWKAPGNAFTQACLDAGGLDESPIGPLAADEHTREARCSGGFSLGDNDVFYSFEGDGDQQEAADNVIQDVAIDVDAEGGGGVPFTWRADWQNTTGPEAGVVHSADARRGCASSQDGFDADVPSVKDALGLNATQDVTIVLITIRTRVNVEVSNSTDGELEDPCSDGTVVFLPVFPLESGTIAYDWSH